MRRALTASLLLAAVLAAAPSGATAPVASPTLPIPARRVVALPSGFAVRPGDVLLHKASGTEFPRRLAGFTRASVEPFDTKGHDAAVSYRYLTKGEPVVARVTLLHVEMLSPRDHFVSMRPLVGSYFRGLSFTNVRPLEDRPVVLEGMKRGTGYQGHFSAMLGRVPYELSLTTVNFGYWDVRLTAAYPATQAAEARERIVALVAALRQTGPTKRPAK